MVALLVVKYAQQMPVAWGYTLREFFLIADMNRDRIGRKLGAWTPDKLADFENYLKDQGAT